MSGHIIHDRGDIAVQAAQSIASMLDQAISTRGQATLMVSGGSSPKPLYEKLSHADIAWSKVTISLVDERWVDPGQAGSNEDFIRENLIKNKAAVAKFFGLKTRHETVETGLKAAENRFSATARPFDVCVMGMGADAHTASWFPNAKGLKHAFDLKNKNRLCYVDATGCSVAGEHTDRISLTLSSVLASHAVLLFIPGAQKRAVFEAAIHQAPKDAPVNTLLAAGNKLHVFASSS